MDNENFSKTIYNLIEDYIFETHKLCSIKDIQARVSQGNHIIKKALDELISQDKIYIAYCGKGVPNLYIPKYMMTQILLTQSKPEWLKDYYFKERDEIETKIREQTDKLLAYEIFERLLYATGEPLEEAVCYALNWLDAKNVHHYKTGDKDIQDIEFEIGNTKYLVEVKGKTKPADKDDVEELNGWRKQEVLKKENENKRIECLLIVNHFRKMNPKDRKEMLTIHAQKWLKMYGLRVFPTSSLFDLIREVKQGKITKKGAVEKIVQGQKI